jgi:hypothetical protein
MSEVIRRIIRAIGICLAVTGVGGCDVAGPRACTLIGCTDGLTVEVIGLTSPGPITVVVIAPDGASRSATVTCAGGASCPFLFGNFSPTSVTINVSAGSQSRQVTVQPDYQTNRPNGPECPPECRSARVTVAL